MNPADTAFIILCATFVMLMTPALALFYGGLVRSKNILSTCMHSYAALGMVSILWALFGYSLAFSGDISGLIGNLDHVFHIGVGGEANGPAANLPHNVFMAFQCMFAALTVALISGAYAERIRFSAMLVFSALWTVFVYCPRAAAGWPSWALWTLPVVPWCTWLPPRRPWPAPMRWAPVLTSARRP